MKGRVVWKVISIIPIAILIIGMGLVASFMNFATNTVYLIPLVIALCVLVLVYYIFRLFGWLKKSNGKKVFYSVTGSVLAIALFFVLPDAYDRLQDRVTDTGVDLWEYVPFGENTKAVVLDGTPTLKIEEDLPIIDGATALYPVYAAFAQAVYPEKEYIPYDSEVMSNRTGEAYENLMYGRADIIFALAPSEAQIKKAKGLGRELKLTPIGKEAFVFFVNSKNRVESLTTDEIKGIYSGEITNWKDVGGKNKEIRAFQRPQDSGSQTALQHFMGDAPIMDPPVEDIASLMGTIIDQVSDYRNYNNSIGFTFRYYSTEMVKDSKIRLLDVNGVEPTIEGIRAGDYPITNELYAITAGSKNPHVDELIEWVLSEQGQEIVEKTGYVPIH